MLTTEAYRIRIFSKKLSSGKCQVKFYLKSNKKTPYYGYLLVDSGRTVNDVIEMIYTKLKKIDQPDLYFHDHLYNLQRKSKNDPDFMLFRQEG
jgi:hypothetical protein